MPLQSVSFIIRDSLSDGVFSLRLLSEVSRRFVTDENGFASAVIDNHMLDLSGDRLSSSSVVRREVAVLQLAMSALALPGAFPRSAAKVLVDTMLTSLLPQSQDIHRSNRDTSARSSSSSSFASHTDSVNARFAAWTAVIAAYIAWEIHVPQNILSHYAGEILVQHLSAITDIKLRIASLCSILESTLQQSGYQPDQQWLDEMSELLQILPGPPASSTKGSSPWQAVFAANGATKAELSVLQLHQLICYLHSCTTCFPSPGLKNLLTASVALNASEMALDTLIELAYILAQWDERAPATLQQHLLTRLSPVSFDKDTDSSTHVCHDAAGKHITKVNISAAKQPGPLQTLAPIQQLRTVWLLEGFLGEQATQLLLFPDAAAWNAFHHSTLEALSFMPALQLLDMGPLVLSHIPQTAKGTTGKASGSKDAQLWLSAYSDASSAFADEWMSSSVNISKLAVVIVRLYELCKVSLMLLGDCIA